MIQAGNGNVSRRSRSRGQAIPMNVRRVPVLPMDLVGRPRVLSFRPTNTSGPPIRTIHGRVVGLAPTRYVESVLLYVFGRVSYSYRRVRELLKVRHANSKYQVLVR